MECCLIAAQPPVYLATQSPVLRHHTRQLPSSPPPASARPVLPLENKLYLKLLLRQRPNSQGHCWPNISPILFKLSKGNPCIKIITMKYKIIIIPKRISDRLQSLNNTVYPTLIICAKKFYLRILLSDSLTVYDINEDQMIGINN
jgi:hypothetical protein